MFGYILPNTGDLTQEQTQRYKSLYCGLCRALQQNYGAAGRATLTYDMTFLVMLLSSLYEPQEQSGNSRCVAHPSHRHPFVRSDAADYCAAMNVALTYHNCLDDWNDDKKLRRLAVARLLEDNWQSISAAWPRQCQAITQSLRELAQLEKENCQNPDLPANCFGQLMGELFVWKPQDHWAETLRQCGSALGRFIYMMDAALDLEKDEKSGSYNPLRELAAQGKATGDFRQLLVLLIAECTQQFEKLPLCQDVDILRNILYSGIWSAFNEAAGKGKAQ